MGDANLEKASTENLRQAGDRKGLPNHDSLATKGGDEPLFFRVEEALRRQVVEANGRELTGPLVSQSKRPTSVSALQKGRHCDTKQQGCFPFLRRVKSKEPKENGHPHPETHFAGIRSVDNPIIDVAMRVSGEGRRRSTSSIGTRLVSESNDTRQLDLAFTHSFRNSYGKAVGDFTSITFELEDFSDTEENNEIHSSTLSLPNTQEANLKLQVLRPLTSPGTKEKSLFLTSHSIGRHLPPLGEQASLNGETFTDLSHNLESWMSLLPRTLQQLPLNHLYIPGSHDSFSYSLDPDGEVAPDAPDPVRGLVRVVPCLARPALLRWSVTQRATVTEQLRHGVRYFDIRVATRGSKFYFVHGLFGADLQPLLSEVRLFLAQHPGEVVLLDFQHFHGLGEEDHAALVALLRSTFATTLCPVFSHPDSLNLYFLTHFKYQVLVFYRHAAGRTAATWLWPSEMLPNPWPAATTVSAMLNFLQTRLTARDPDTFFVTQCVLTPSGNYLARNVCGSLEANLAVPTNEVLSVWLKRLPSGPPGANVIMTDFVEHNSWEVPRAIINKNLEVLLPPPAMLKA